MSPSVFLVLGLIINLSSGDSVKSGNELTCDICVDIITDIGKDNLYKINQMNQSVAEFLTSKPTEDEILNFFNQICEVNMFINQNLSKVTLFLEAADQLIPGVGETCTNFLFNNGYGIIESIVHENLNPLEICTNYSLCP